MTLRKTDSGAIRNRKTAKKLTKNEKKLENVKIRKSEAKTPVIVFVEDYNGKFYVVGLYNGAEVTGGTIVSGAAMGDLSGFTLTFEGMETAPPFFVAESIITAQVSTAKIDPNA